MDERWLRSQLESGRSIEAIAREVGRDPSTVAYWVNKYRLASQFAARHRNRGPLTREELARLVEEGLTIEEMASRLDRGFSTVRYWLRRHDLQTARARGEPRAEEGDEALRRCRTHGFAVFVRTRSGHWRCRRCQIAAVSNRRRKVKEILVAEAGGACARCGYARYAGALQFHHLDPSQKSFGLATGGLARSLARARAEVAKCVLLCANCHPEIEAGLATIAPVRPCRLRV
jgi:transposase-like protein